MTNVTIMFLVVVAVGAAGSLVVLGALDRSRALAVTKLQRASFITVASGPSSRSLGERHREAIKKMALTLDKPSNCTWRRPQAQKSNCPG